MTTKNPRDKITWASKEERERVAEFLQCEFGSIGAGLRASLNLLLKKHKQPKLDESQWGGKRNAGKKEKAVWTTSEKDTTSPQSVADALDLTGSLARS